MTARNDVDNEMRSPLLDSDTLERLLGGRIEPADAPPGYAETARVLRAATRPVDRVRPSLEAEHVAAAATLITRSVPRGTSNRTRSTGRRLKVAGLVVVGMLLCTSGLAAAGILPDSAQDAVSDVLDRIGVSVPHADHPAMSGEQAELEQTSDSATTANPADAGKGAQISQIATTTDAAGVEKGAEISSAASDGKSQAGQHGTSAGESGDAPVTTPNAGGTTTADAASGGHSHAGTDVAAEKSDGRSAAGAGNASSGHGH